MDGQFAYRLVVYNGKHFGWPPVKRVGRFGGYQVGLATKMPLG
jgi:uncharacterized protein YprB with RNaseH-like and TPR domain